jgi:chitin disaccharide deacetylase
MSVIINADDFAASESGNLTTLKLFEAGVVSSTTIIANGNYFNMAVDILKDNPQLGAGVHLCLDGPNNIGNQYNSIIDQSTKQFYNNHQIAQKLKKWAVNESEMYQEYCLQIEKVLDHKIQISHLDHHHHLHLYLPALRAMIKVAKRFKISYIRSQKIVMPTNKNYLNNLYRNFHQLYVKSRYKTIDGFFEPHMNTESDSDKLFLRLSELLKIKDKVIEVVLHPHSEDDPETRFFTNKKTSQLLSGVKIINFNDFR